MNSVAHAVFQPTRRRMARALPALLVASFSLFARGAQAQERDPAAAQALFDQARQLMKGGKFAEACPKLVESNRLDPGIGTEFHLADCYEQSGRFASAWAQFLDVASQARASGQAEREKAALARADRLVPRLPHLVISVPQASQVPGLEIRRNGVAVGPAQWGAPVAVDPGDIELTATAPGKQPLRQTVHIEEGKSLSYNLPALAIDETSAEPDAEEDEEKGWEVTPKPRKKAPEPPASSSKPAPAAKPGRANTGWVLGLAGLGVVGVGVGTTFSILASNANADSKAGNKCAPTNANRCNREGVELRNDAIDKGNIATACMVVSGALFASAGIVWALSGPRDRRGSAEHERFVATPVVGQREAGLLMRGSF